MSAWDEIRLALAGAWFFAGLAIIAGLSEPGQLSCAAFGAVYATTLGGLDV